MAALAEAARCLAWCGMSTVNSIRAVAPWTLARLSETSKAIMGYEKGGAAFGAEDSWYSCLLVGQ